MDPDVAGVADVDQSPAGPVRQSLRPFIVMDPVAQRIQFCLDLPGLHRLGRLPKGPSAAIDGAGAPDRHIHEGCFFCVVHLAQVQ